MKNLYVFVMVFLILNLCGCASLLKSRIGTKENKLQAIGSDIGERSRQLTTAVLDISYYSLSSASNPEIMLINKIALEDQRIEGLPVQKLDTAYLLEISEEKRNKEFQSYVDQNTTLLLQKRQLKTEISTLEQRLKSRGFLGRIIRWVGIPGLIVALFIFCPGAILPIISWLTNKIPGLIGFLGIASKRVVDNVISGVQQAREELKKDPNKTYEAKDVLQMLDQKLSEEQDQSTKAVVRARKLVRKNKMR